MLANTTGERTKVLSRRFPGMIGNLFSSGTQRTPVDWRSYALDNERYVAFKNRTEWDEAKWLKLLEWAKCGHWPPLWALVPDVVGNRTATIESWHRYRDAVGAYGWPLAFAVQDGMVPADVPRDASVVFVGGSTKWKWTTVQMWCEFFPRVHVGRVNQYRRLNRCHELGVESCDGTGFMRAGHSRQFRGLLAYLEETAGHKERPEQFEFTAPGFLPVPMETAW